MKRVFHLATCSTCQRIIRELALDKHFDLQNIKTEPITPEQIDAMVKLSGSYEALFSRRAMKFRSMGLAEQNLTEQDYRRLILQEYTFLKRPVTILDNNIYIGNSKKAVESLEQALTK